MKSTTENGKFTVSLEGRIDSNNAPEVEAEILKVLSDNEGKTPVFDASDLEYISSAGLRVLMKVRKQVDDKISVIDVSPEVYDIFETTGFTELLDVRKRLRLIDVSGAEQIGKGGNGTVYRLDKETIVKVFRGVSNTPEKINKDRLTSRAVFTHGIDTAIPYDTVKVTGDSEGTLGVVYEMIDAMSLGQYLDSHKDDFDEYAHKMAVLLKTLHSTEFDSDVLDDARNLMYHRMTMTRECGYFSEEELDIMTDFIDSFPTPHIFIHGDYHPGNILVRDGELIIIDVGDSGYGHPVLDFMSLHSLCTTGAKDDACKEYCGLGGADIGRLFDLVLRGYFDTDDDSRVKRIMDAIGGIGMIKLLQGIIVNPSIPEELKAGAIAMMKPAFFENVDQIKLSLEHWDQL